MTRTPNKICRFCKHWQFPSEDYPHQKKGDCLLTDSRTNMVLLWSTDEGQDTFGNMLTHPDHGCNEWQPEENTKT